MSDQERIERLEKALHDCVEAMERSIEDGSTDHLDCSPDGGSFWFDARDNAKKLLNE